VALMCPASANPVNESLPLWGRAEGLELSLVAHLAPAECEMSTQH
jgi:hypothetical protein